MAERSTFLRQFDYKANAALVLQSENRSQGGAAQAARESSDVQSLAQQKSIQQMRTEMGQRVSQPKAAAAADKKSQDRKRTATSSLDDRAGTKRLATHIVASSRLLTSELTSQYYEPLSEATKSVFATLLTFVQFESGVIEPDVLRSLADEVLHIIKGSNEDATVAQQSDSASSMRQQQKDISDLFQHSMTDDRFRVLLNICRKINDFRSHDDDQTDDQVRLTLSDGPAAGGTISQSQLADAEFGVSLILDEDEEQQQQTNRRDAQRNDNKDEDEAKQERKAQGMADEVQSDESESDEEEDEALNDDALNDDAMLDQDSIAASKQKQQQQSLHSRSKDSKAGVKSIGQATALSVHAIDAHWLQRALSASIDDAPKATLLAGQVFELLSDQSLSNSRLENELVALLGLQLFALIKTLLSNRTRLVVAITLQRCADEDERHMAETKMRQSGDESVISVLEELHQIKSEDKQQSIASAPVKRSATEAPVLVAPLSSDSYFWQQHKRRTKLVDLQALADSAAAALAMSHADVALPKDSEMIQHKNWTEVHVPAPPAAPGADPSKLRAVSSLPGWARPAFAGISTLNRVQSAVFPCAMESNENLLMCAPTGAGKTNVAMLTMLREIGNHLVIDEATQLPVLTAAGLPQVQVQNFLLVYIAPIKSLVQEMVLNFTQRLGKYGITVAELSGDASLSRDQIQNTQIIVTTPEKWDIIGRKSSNTYTNLVRLLIIDEVHILNDTRGAVIEAIVARTIRHVESSGEAVRIVGLSATLPNYTDVAAFLRVKPDKGLFFFDYSYRPVPLHQCYIGVSATKAFKRAELMNQIVGDKVTQALQRQKQILVFVHSRKETVTVANFLRDRFEEEDRLDLLVQQQTGRAELLKSEVASIKSVPLAKLLPSGIAVHHAGLARSDRSTVEELFADKHIQVLVCTATLAFGINLPAAVVIIKGTTQYNAEKSAWVQMSQMDVHQMVSRSEIRLNALQCKPNDSI